MKAFDLNGKTVLVTGASSGLGREISIQLARDFHCHLVVAARREDRLLLLQQELERDFGVNVFPVVADLSRKDDTGRLLAIALGKHKVDAAVLNAGVTFFGRNLQLPTEQFENIIDTNIKSIVRMTNALVAHFEARQQPAAIMLISSMAAFFPAPYQAVYSASKAFILAYANAFSQEITNPGLSITVFTPGGIKTEMTSGEGFGDLQSWLMPVGEAAREAIYALRKRKFYYIPGFFNRIGARFMRILPRQFLSAQLGKVYVRSLDKNKNKDI